MALLNLPENWKDDAKYWQPIARAVAGIDWRPSDSVLQGYVDYIERTINKGLEKALPINEVVQKAAAGGGVVTDAPIWTLSLVGALNDLLPVLSDEGVRLLNTKKNEAQVYLVEYGGQGALQAENFINQLSDRTGVSSDITNKVLEGFSRDLGKRRALLDYESTIRSGQPLSGGDIEILKNQYGIDANQPDALNKINEAITATPGLRDVRNTLDETSAVKAINEQQKSGGIQDDCVFSIVWGIYGLRFKTVDDMQPRVGKDFLGDFIRNKELFGSY